MNIKTILLASTAVFALSAPAFAVDKESYESTVKVEKDSAGNYSETAKTTKTDADRTTYVTEKKLKIDVDAKGNTDKSSVTEIITDPKGMGNKHIVTVKDTEKTKNGEVTVTHTKTVNGKTVEGTNDNYKTSSVVKSDAKGNYEEKDITVTTDASGTTTRSEVKATVDIDAKGNTDKTTTTKDVVDPQGLNNKSTVTTSNTEKVKDGLVKTSQEVKVDGKTVESKSKTSTQ